MARNPNLDESFRTARHWRQEAYALRDILLDCGLTEELKWRKPCYTHDGRNICIIQRMNDSLALMFFKGALLKDPDGVLERQGPHSRAGFRMRFTSVPDVLTAESSIRALVHEAIAVEKGGLKVEMKPTDFECPEELAARFDEEPDFKAAFYSLTPGRQRHYAMYFSSARQSKTRAARIERYRGKILDGKGMRDR